MTNPSEEYAKRPILTNPEIDEMLTKADNIPDEYSKLRVKAVIALVKKFGKRRAEIGVLKRNDLAIQNNYLHITFTIRKKHKKGLFQYLHEIKKLINSGKLPANYLNNKNYLELTNEWKEWNKTKEGSRLSEAKRTKKLSVEDRYCKIILEYLECLNEFYPAPTDPAKTKGKAFYLFPSPFYVFGNLVTMNLDKSLSGSQLLRLIKPLGPTVWLHLFRETKGAEIAKEYGNNLSGITQVKETLDLEKEETAYRYTRRYAEQEITAET